MAQNLTNFDAVLKDFYDEPLRSTINNEVVAFKILDEADREWSGRRVIFPFKSGRSPAVGARAEGGTLPTQSQQGYAQSIVSATYQYGVIQISGQVLEAGKNAFVASLESEIKGLADDLVNDLSRQCWTYGDGRMAQVGAAAASASTITVYNRFFEPGQNGAKYLYEGQRIDVGTVANPVALCSSQVISALSISQNPATTVDTITVTASSLNGSQCESYLFNRGAGGAGIELMGIQGLLDVYTQANIFGSNAFAGATVQNISRVTVSNWNSIVLANSGVARIVDGHLMQTAFDRVSAESGVEPDTIWGHHDVLRAFLESVAGDRRYTTPDFNAGMSKLTYNGVPLVKDRHAPYNTLLVFKRDVLKMFTLSDFKWADEDGSILSRVGGEDAYNAFYRCYKQLGINDFPKKACFIRDIQTDF